MKTLILTNHSVNTPHETLANLTRANKQQYADKHGYTFASVVSNYDRAGMLDGFMNLKNLLIEYERIMTVGADVIFINHAISLDEFEYAPLTIAREHNSFWPVNNDVLIWQRCVQAFDIIDRMIDDIDLWTQYCWYWQVHLWNLMCKEPFYKRNITVVEARRMNSSPMRGLSEYQLGDFIVHLFGFPIEKKIELAKHYLNFAGDCDGSFDPRRFPELRQLN